METTTGKAAPRGEKFVDLVIDGSIARIAINRPSKFNALNYELAKQIVEILRDLEFSQLVRVVTLTGNGKAFIAGADVSEFEGPIPDRLRTIAKVNDCFHELIRMIARLKVPVIAGIHGAVAGGGVGIALASDIVIAAEDTRLVPAYLKLGATPDAGTTWNAVRMMGRKRAYEWFITGRPIEMVEALAVGIVNRVVPASALNDHVAELARAVSEGPAFAHTRLKELLKAAECSQFESHLDDERASFLDCAEGTEFTAGVSAFLTKKSPKFRS